MNQAQPLLWEHAATRRARRRLAQLRASAQAVARDYQVTLVQLRAGGAPDGEVFLHQLLLERAFQGATGGQEASYLELGTFTCSGALDARDTPTQEWWDDTEEQNADTGADTGASA